MARNACSRTTTFLFFGIAFVLYGVMMALYMVYSYYAFPFMREATFSSQCYLFIGLAVVCFAVGAAFIVTGLHRRSEERKTLERVRGLSGGGVSPREFLSAREALMRNGDFTGIYVIHNLTKDMYYVGQSTRVVGRVSQHFCGRGNGDVYADYKYGDEFEISLVSLCESGYESLDALERDTIKAYDAYEHGYNRTRGNRS